MLATQLMLLGLTLATSPPDVDNPQTRAWSALRERLAKDKVRLRYLTREEGTIIQDVRKLERSIERGHGAFRTLKKKKSKVENRMLALDQELEENAQKIKRLTERSGPRLAALARAAQAGQSNLLGLNEGWGQRQRTTEWLRFIAAYDGKLFREIRLAKDKNLSLKEALRQDRKHLDDMRHTLLLKDQDRGQLLAARAELLQGIRRERSSRAQLLQELKATAARLVTELGVVHGRDRSPKPRPGGFAQQKGILPWPVPGRIEVPFGKKVDPDSQLILMQTGIDIRAPLLTPIRAVFHGQVVYSSRLPGYGQTIVLRHGDHTHTIYTHLESKAIRLKQKVRQHAILGYVGDTDSEKGAYLYFEIRTRGQPQDPSDWLHR